MERHDPYSADDDRLFVADSLFGITALSAVFHQDWRNTADTPEELVVWWSAGEGEGQTERLSLLVQDALRLIRSPLSGQEIAELWNSCYQAGIPAGVDWTWGRGWMTQVARIGAARLADRRVAADPFLLPECRHGAPHPDMLAFTDRLPAAFATAWVRCAEKVCPELALRFLITGLNDAQPVLTPGDLGVLERLGHEYGHGAQMLEAIRYLAEPE